MSISADRIAADIAAIGRITQTPGQGATRPTFSREWGEARDYVIAEARKVDCIHRIDAAGNVFVKPRALPADAPTWLVGSHIDTVPHGGDYDGVAGVVTALELLRSAHEDGVTPPLELVIFAEEEGPTFGLGMLGSRAMVGELSVEQLASLKNKEAQTYLEAGQPFGVVPSEIAASRIKPEHHLGLIELHIEQGPGMWRRDQRLAVVTAIAGRRQYKVTIEGEANHAGATAMCDRRDALAAASEVVVALESLAKRIGEEVVITVGRLDVSPNAVNVIADRVTFTIDFRSPSDVDLDLGDREIRALILDICHRRGDLKFETLPTESIPARPMATLLVGALKRSAAIVGCGEMPTAVSGALHDSAVLAPHLPTVMLFVPSKGGISHNPAEFSRVEDIAAGTRVIEHLIRRPTLAMLNAMNRDAFVRAIGGSYEHSPRIAERTHALGPFASIDALSNAMSQTVRNASRDEQLALIRAHPDLVGRLAREGKLTRESTVEQSAAGLTSLTPAEIEAFERHNAAYREKFGFPFVICARENKKDAILAAFPERLQNSVDQEVATARTEIDKIAALRLRDILWE